MTTPVASATAAASAGAVHRIAPSLTPLEPRGPGPSPFSTTVGFELERHILGRRDAIVESSQVSDSTVVVEE